MIMGWTVLAPGTANAAPKTFQLPYDSPRSLVLTKLEGYTSLGIVGQLIPNIHIEVGQMTMGEWGVKLEAVNDVLSIHPRSVDTGIVAATTPPPKRYELKPRLDERSEIILLRQGDVICSSQCEASLVLQWCGPEVQVNSSAADPVETTETTNGIAETPEEDKTEDEDADKPVVAVSATQTKSTQAKSQQSRATPRLSNPQGLIVQETPTAARFIAGADSYAIQEAEGHHLESMEATPLQSFVNQASETFSTAHTGESQGPMSTNHANPDHFPSARRASDLVLTEIASAMSEHEDGNIFDNDVHHQRSSPQVVITPTKSKKRPSPGIEDVELVTTGRSSKRTKTTASTPERTDSDDSRLSNIVVDTTYKVAAKSKKRTSGGFKAKEKTPARSQPDSQRSSQTATDLYEGPTPQVAFSNSSITAISQAIKFLKRQKGGVVESMSDECNVLCVRPGALTKTMKLLESIALGIPIVTDKWLLDSAKAGQFLALRDYQPLVPQQEKEWNFQLDKVWGKPQSPFEGYTLFFTPELQKSYSDFNEIREVCKSVGAKVASKKMSKAEKFVMLAKEDKDKEAEKWMQDGGTCYSKDLLTNSILRGEVDLDSQEFVIGQGVSDGGANRPKPKKARKS